MSDYFYSLGMLITGRMHEHPNLSAMDLLEWAIADESEHEPSPLIAFMFKESK